MKSNERSDRPWRFLLFGASGAIGAAIDADAVARGWQVTRITRSRTSIPADTSAGWLVYDPLRDTGEVFAGVEPFDAVCWAQGANSSDSVRDFDLTAHMQLYEANCASVLSSLAQLFAHGLLSPEGARMVVIGSIWQERARPNKLSYTVTKAAVGGIVRSVSVDLGPDGHLINGVLPGVTDTPMTRANLSDEQVRAVEGRTPAGRLADLRTLSHTVLFLCSADNASISGQSITVDLGMSNAILL